jgi:transcriptional regulator with XRE-family HTH domain
MSDNEQKTILAQVGAAVRAARRERGLTQEAVATRARLQRSYVAGVETGNRNVSVLSLARIASALDADLNFELARRE